MFYTTATINPEKVLGTYSHRSLRNADILAGICAAIDAVNEQLSFTIGADEPGGAIRTAYNAGEALAIRAESCGPDDIEEAISIGDAVSAWIGERTDGRCYFGSTEGDGSDFGIWYHEPEG